jgi:hypothetical protein
MVKKLWKFFHRTFISMEIAWDWIVILVLLKFFWSTNELDGLF